MAEVGLSQARGSLTFRAFSKASSLRCASRSKKASSLSTTSSLFCHPKTSCHSKSGGWNGLKIHKNTIITKTMSHYVYMYVWSSYTARVRINRVRSPILLVVSSTGKIIFPCPRSRLRIWSRETGSAVSSRVSLLISILRLNLVLIYGIPPDFRGGVHLFL